VRTVTVGGVEVGRGTRVVLRPRPGADIFDQAIAGKVAVVDRVDEDMEGLVQLAVVVEDDPGRDMGEMRQPGHRFFFSPEEVEPLTGQPRPAMRVLVAGIGNIFMGDDGFGVEVARRLAGRELPGGVEVADFGIRGMDLVYALGNGWEGVILVDAMRRGEEPGTLIVLDPEVPAAPVAPLDGHTMDPLAVLAAARSLGTVPRRVLVVGCEPLRVPDVDGGEDMVTELSAVVERVVELADAFSGSGRFATTDAASEVPLEVRS
jgi:hydrogenase maturation protease